MDALSAARWQITLSLAFHIVFAAIGIGLPLLLVIAERRYLSTGRQHYLLLARKWSKAVAVLFAVGAISGTALSLQLGLLWPRFMEMCGTVVGHIFGLEGFAFFAEAIFIGLYLYGWDRLSPRAHWWCGVVVAVSGAVSGILILGVNAWMQLPVGFTVGAGGQVTVTDPLAIFKQYGWFAMALHSTLACYMAVSFAVAGVYAWGWLKGRRDDYHKSAIRIAMTIGALSAILQPVSGDLLAKFVFKRDPVKFAAMEGQYTTQTRAPLRLGGIPDEKTQTTRWAIEIPGMLSFLANHDFSTEVIGLDKAAPLPHQRPNVVLTHLAFQVMVGVGTLLMVLGIWFWIAWWRKGEAALKGRALPWAMVVLSAGGFVALETGWVVTEVGRQPYTIVGEERFAPMRAAGASMGAPADMKGYAGLLTSDAVTGAAGVEQILWGFTVLFVLLAIATIAALRQVARNPVSSTTD